MTIDDEELIQELSDRFARSRKAFSDLSVVNRKLLEMNERLEASESLKSNFLSNIRNEINNPLNAIMGLSREMAVIGGENGEITALAAMIGAEAATLDFQLRNIFLAAELEAGEVSPHCTRLHFFSVLQEVTETFRHSAARKNVQLHLMGDGNCDTAVAAVDSSFLQAIVSNLIANAIEYSSADGAVEISGAIAEDGSLQVSVRDFGIGVAPEDQQRIFDRFVQLDTGSTRHHPGHGLGLSITKALVDLMQGSITLTSIPGAGTLFTVQLPPCSRLADEESFSEAGNLFLFGTLSEV